MGLMRRVRNLVQQEYESVQYLDIHDSWSRALINALVMNPRPEDEKMRLYTYNIILIICHILNTVRFGSLFAVSDDDNAHLYGHSYSHLKGAKVASATATIFYAQCCLYRIALMRLIMTEGLIIAQTLKNIVNERDSRLRDSKKQMAKNVLLCAAVGFVVIMMSGSALFAGMHVMHILFSKSSLETCCWLFWWMVDILALALGVRDIAIFPAMWFLIASNYRTDVIALAQKIDHANGPDVLCTETTCDNICYSYLRLVEQAVTVNRMSSLILFALVICTTPFFCTALFAIEYGGNIFISVTFFIAIFPIVLFAWTLLAIAGEITSLTEGLHGRLCSLAAKASTGTRTFLTQRIQLQQLVEETGSEDQLLALRTIDGQKYTSESLMYYLIETGLQYTLLLTFDRSMKLQ